MLFALVPRLARVIAISASLSLVSGCASDSNRATALSETETLVFGQVLVYDSGVRVNKRPLVFLTPPTFQPKHGVALTYPGDWVAFTVCDDAGYFQMASPLGTYGMLVQYELRRPMPQGHGKEWLRISPAVSTSLARGRSATYIGTLTVNIREVSANRVSEVEPHIVANIEVIDETGDAYTRLLAQRPKDGSLPRVSSLLASIPNARPTVDFAFAPKEYRIP